MNSATGDLTELKLLKSELAKFRSARVRVGVLGNKADRFDEDWNKSKLNNPTLGLIHEFGIVAMGPAPEGKNIPRTSLPARSFLRMPLTNYLPKEIDKIGRAVWRAIILKKGVLVALGDLGQIARNVVDRAFATGGFGYWAPNSPRTIKRKGSSKPLIDSAQLRKSVSWRVDLGRAA